MKELIVPNKYNNKKICNFILDNFSDLKQSKMILLYKSCLTNLKIMKF